MKFPIPKYRAFFDHVSNYRSFSNFLSSKNINLKYQILKRERHQWRNTPFFIFVFFFQHQSGEFNRNRCSCSFMKKPRPRLVFPQRATRCNSFRAPSLCNFHQTNDALLFPVFQRMFSGSYPLRYIKVPGDEWCKNYVAHCEFR